MDTVVLIFAIVGAVVVLVQSDDYPEQPALPRALIYLIGMSSAIALAFDVGCRVGI